MPGLVELLGRLTHPWFDGQRSQDAHLDRSAWRSDERLRVARSELLPGQSTADYEQHQAEDHEEHGLRAASASLDGDPEINRQAKRNQTTSQCANNRRQVHNVLLSDA